MTDLSAPCLRCGGPAGPQTHHGRPDNPQMGKGAGGAKDWPDHDLYAVCDRDHKALHAKKWSFRVTDGMVELLAPGDDQWVIGRRGLVLSEEEVCVNCHHWRKDHSITKDETSWLCFHDGCLCEAFAVDNLLLSDIALSEAWAKADSTAVTALQQQCEIADALRQRYSHTTHKWYERAAEILGEQGKHVHWRRVYERCDLMALFGPTEEHPKGRWEAMEKLGMTVALAITRLPAEARPAALELALDMNAEFKPAKEISAAIKGDIAESAKETCVCGEGEGCGHEHRRKGA